MKKLSGKRLHGRFFSLLVAPLSGNKPKFATVVSKKTAVKAVDRNKIKRHMRSALAKAAPAVKAPQALVLYAKAEVKNANYRDILNDIESLFLRLESR
ncbi:MAG: ribonuclease P protein component [Candidatus Pacebacteria bacterium]|nr:ribonuclease P protein component [Candidatus Paceibacterota bacterium]